MPVGSESGPQQPESAEITPEAQLEATASVIELRKSIERLREDLISAPNIGRRYAIIGNINEREAMLDYGVHLLNTLIPRPPGYWENETQIPVAPDTPNT